MRPLDLNIKNWAIPPQADPVSHHARHALSRRAFIGSMGATGTAVGVSLFSRTASAMASVILRGWSLIATAWQLIVGLRNWQRLLIAIGAFVTLAVVTLPSNVFADEHDVEGSWYITVQVTDPFQLTFDATYSFAKGGAFTRIDGRNNAPAVGTWKRTDDGQIVFSNILFNFTSSGVRNGAIAGKFSARVVDGTMTGTFTAHGILGLTGFHRAGTFTGVPIAAEAP